MAPGATSGAATDPVVAHASHASHASPVLTGLVAAFVGFAGSLPVVLKGLSAMGATPAQAASGLMALAVAMGACGVLLSVRTRMPVSAAWSTPGAALLAASAVPAGGYATAVGAFVACGALLALAGAWRPLARAVGAIPSSLGAAMLAGVVLPLCLAPVKAIAAAPELGLPIVLAWALVGRWRRIWAVPAALVVAVALGTWAVVAGPAPSSIALPTVAGATAAASHAPTTLASLLTAPSWTMPVFEPAAIVGIALPLFLVTMATQNVPGIAVLDANGYQPDPGPLFRTTGIASLLVAPFGGHAVNLAAITAALCAGPDAHSDPDRRWQAAVVAGIAYVVLGCVAGAAVAFFGTVPPVLVETVAGLALLGALGGALAGLASEPHDRDAAVVAFVVAASGVTLAGIGPAFWGLVAGGTIRATARRA